jgi:hypothetical protein
MNTVRELAGVNRDRDITHVLARSHLCPVAVIDVLFVIEDADGKDGVVCEYRQSLDAC